MISKTPAIYSHECIGLVEPARYTRHGPGDGIEFDHWWEKVFPDGSSTSITYGNLEPLGPPSQPFWAVVHNFGHDTDSLIAAGLTLPDALTKAASFKLAADRKKEKPMTDPSKYSIARLIDGRFRLDRSDGAVATAVAYAKPFIGRTGRVEGWKLYPILVVQGSRSKVWTHPWEALASTKLMTAAAARSLIDETPVPSIAGEP